MRLIASEFVDPIWHLGYTQVELRPPEPPSRDHANQGDSAEPEIIFRIGRSFCENCR